MDQCALKTILQTLHTKRSLSALHLDSCGIIDSYIFECKECLLHMKFLEELRLCNNFITDQGGAVLEQVLFANKLLSRVKVENNSMNVRTVHMIQKAAADNSESKKYDSPDFTYYKFVDDRQQQEREQLLGTLAELNQQHEDLTYRTILAKTAIVDAEAESI